MNDNGRGAVAMTSVYPHTHTHTQRLKAREREGGGIDDAVVVVVVLCDVLVVNTMGVCRGITQTSTDLMPCTAMRIGSVDHSGPSFCPSQ